MPAGKSRKKRKTEKKMIPLDKMSKRERRAHFAARRGDWNGLDPVTRVIPDKRRRALKKPDPLSEPFE